MGLDRLETDFCVMTTLATVDLKAIRETYKKIEKGLFSKR